MRKSSGNWVLGVEVSTCGDGPDYRWFSAAGHVRNERFPKTGRETAGKIGALGEVSGGVLRVKEQNTAWGALYFRQLTS